MLARPILQPEDAGGSWHPPVEAWLRAVSDSEATQSTYRWALRQACRWLDTPVPELRPADLDAWRLHVLRRTDYSSSSKHTLVSALRVFLEWAQRRSLTTLAPAVIAECLRSIRCSTETPRGYLADPDAARLLACAGRDIALLATLLGAGLRIGEALRLDCPDLAECSDGWVLHVKGKGARTRVVPLPVDVTGILLGCGAQGPMFRSHRGGRLWDDEARLRVKRIAWAAGITQHVTPHMLRHTYAMRLHRAGVPTAAIQRLLGHASVTTTAIYLQHIDLADLAKVVVSLPRLTDA